MSEKRRSYNQILKSTSIFGGVQVVQIILQIIRSKFVAILLGPLGMGVMGLFQSTINIISSSTNLGLGTSAIKNIAQASAEQDVVKIEKTVSVMNKLVLFTGLLGMSFTFFFSSWLSNTVFGNDDYSNSFKWLSIVLFLGQLATSKNVVLQGFRKVSLLAKSNILGAFFGVIVGIPIYYLFGLEGIVPVFILSALFTYMVSLYFTKSLNVKNIRVTIKDIKLHGREMLKMGIMISLSGVLTLLSSYILKLYITNISGIAELGFYSVGFTIINTYVGMVFNAMGKDYYPRLSEISDDTSQANKMINEQAEISVIILAPILVVFIVFIKQVIIAMYSNEFIGIVYMVQIMTISVIIKGVSWSMGFLILSKSKSRAFFLNELFANLYMLGFNLIGYKMYGLTGLGYALVIGYIINFIQIYFFIKIKYSYKIDIELIKVFVIQLILLLSSFIVMTMLDLKYKYAYGVFFIFLSAIYSYLELKKRIDMQSIIQKIFSKGLKK